MSNPAKLRVIQWATGGVGKAAIECVLQPSAARAGRMLGTQRGQERPRRRRDHRHSGSRRHRHFQLDELLALDADCVMYSPLVPNDDEVIAILRSGKNVVTPVGWVYPDPDNPRHQAVADAAVEGGVTLHGSGIHPGGITERFPLMISSLSSAVTHVRAEEFSDIRTYNAPDVVRHIMGFGGTPEEAMQGPMATLFEAGFKQSVRMIADHMGFRIEPNIRTIQDVAVATADIDDAPSRSPSAPSPHAGSAGRPWSTASRSSPRRSTGSWARKTWNRPGISAGIGERFEVEITGDPDREPHLQRSATRDDRRRADQESRRRGHRQPLRQRHPRCLRRRARHQDLSGPSAVRRPSGSRSRGAEIMTVLTTFPSVISSSGLPTWIARSRSTATCWAWRSSSKPSSPESLSTRSCTRPASRKAGSSAACWAG